MSNFSLRFIDATEFTLVCFCLEFLQFLAGQKYHYVGSLYELYSLACIVLSISNEYIFTVLVPLGCLQLKKTGLNEENSFFIVLFLPCGVEGFLLVNL
jgi:hypothetical protein